MESDFCGERVKTRAILGSAVSNGRFYARGDPGARSGRARDKPKHRQNRFSKLLHYKLEPNARNRSGRTATFFGPVSPLVAGRAAEILEARCTFLKSRANGEISATGTATSSAGTSLPTRTGFRFDGIHKSDAGCRFMVPGRGTATPRERFQNRGSGKTTSFFHAKRSNANHVAARCSLFVARCSEFPRKEKCYLRPRRSLDGRSRLLVSSEPGETNEKSTANRSISPSG